MVSVIQIDGQAVQVPDDATPEELDQIATHYTAQPAAKDSGSVLDVSRLPANLQAEALQRAGIGTPVDEEPEINLPETSGGGDIGTGDMPGSAKATATPVNIPQQQQGNTGYDPNAGVTVKLMGNQTPEEQSIVQDVKSSTNATTPSEIGSAVRGLEQGVTMGGGDEAKSAVAASVAYPFTDDSWQKLYETALEQNNKELENDTKNNPIASTVGNLAGGMAGAAGSLGALAKVAPEAATWLATGKNFWEARKKDAILGSILGGITGFNSANPVEGGSRLSDAGIGALTGGAAAPVISGAVAGGKPILDKAGNIASTLKRAAFGNTPEQILANKISNPQDVLNQLNNNPIGILPDVAGDSVRGLTRLIGKTSTGRDIVNDALTGRSQDAVDRVVKTLKEVSPVDSYFGNLEDLDAARSKMATPLYKDSFAGNPTIESKAIDKELATPSGKKALSFASEQMQNDSSRMGIPDAELKEQAALTDAKFNGQQVARGLNLRSLDYVKRGFDSQIRAAIRDGDNDVVRILTGQKNKLVSELDKADTTGKYAQARKIYSDSKTLENYQEMGMKFNNMDPEQITAAMKEAEPGEKEAFRIGVRKNLQNIAQKTTEGSGLGPGGRILPNTYAKNQLRAAFDNDAQYEEFAKKMTQEKTAAQTLTKVLGGSNTDRNAGLMDKNLMEKTADHIADHGISLRSLLNALANHIQTHYYGINKSNAAQLASILTDRNKGIETMKKLIAQNQKNPGQLRILGEAIQDIGPSHERLKRSYTIGQSLNNLNKIKVPLTNNK